MDGVGGGIGSGLAGFGFHVGSLASVATFAVAGLLLGLAASRRPAPGLSRRTATWTSGAILVAAAERATSSEPGGFRMLAICSVLFLVMKAVVGVETLARGGEPLPALRWLGFALAWPGMDPAPFAPGRAAEEAGRARRLLRSGAACAAVGSALILASGIAFRRGVPLIAVTPVVIVGASLVLHFGLFSLLAGLWRRAGVPVEAPFRAPLRSASLAEFWGRRWNVPFTEMVRATVYPAARTVAGPDLARLSGFLFSGLLHELAITVPVRAGYGGPLLYFAIQGLLVSLEERVRGAAPSSRSGGARAWVLGALVLPLPLLVPVEFLRQVVWPLVGWVS
jgi:alginate O-acetyltransferase complex protein AlgI